MSLEPSADPRPFIDAETRRRIEIYARDSDVSPDEVVRKAFEEYRASHPSRAERPADETVFDVMDRAGLIGCIGGAPGSPTDLGTDPRHMEGFGRG